MRLRPLAPRGPASAVLVTIAVLALPEPARAQPGQGPPPANVVLDPAIMETVEQRRPITGRIRAIKRSLLASEEEGLVLQLVAELGDALASGDLIARLDDELVAHDLEAARAQVELARARIAEREAILGRTDRDLARELELDAQGAASTSSLDDAQTARAENRALLAQARASLASAQADLARAERRLADMTIRAPFAGEVVSKRTEIGQWVSAGDPVVELVSLDEVEAWIEVPERVAARLRQLLIEDPSLALDVHIDALDETRRGRVTHVIADGDPVSRLFPVRVALENPDHTLRPGMGVVAETPTNRSAPTLTVSKDAVLRDDAGQFVYFNAGGSAMVARIERLFATETRVAIRPGRLQPGMEVVVRGNERLFPMQPLAPQGQDAPGDPAKAQPPAEDQGQDPTQGEGG